jgi:large subunit ribosomal protein L9
MEVILLERVKHLGRIGDRVKVRPGYGRNYLIPQGKALAATQANIEHFESRRAELEQRAARVLGTAEARCDALANLKVTIAAKAGTEGKLFGSVGAREIADAVTEAGVPVSKQEIRLQEGPLRTTGEFEVIVHLHTDVDGTVTVAVVPEG